jgi:two-component system, OmpR family, KDP operon response regulator KdpE
LNPYSEHPTAFRSAAGRDRTPNAFAMISGATVLVVEDDPAMQRVLSHAVAREGARVLVASTAASAESIARRDPPDLYLIDLDLPGEPGSGLIRSLRTWTRKPIIAVTATLDADGFVDALDAGADSCLAKPVAADELSARVRAALRRFGSPTAAEPRRSVRIGEVTVDLAARRVARGTREIRLTPVEYRLLSVFCEHPDKLLSHAMLLEAVWGPTHRSEHQYLHVYVKRLRDKLGLHGGGDGARFENVARSGYQLIGAKISDA